MSSNEVAGGENPTDNDDDDEGCNASNKDDEISLEDLFKTNKNVQYIRRSPARKQSKEQTAEEQRGRSNSKVCCRDRVQIIYFLVR